MLRFLFLCFPFANAATLFTAVAASGNTDIHMAPLAASAQHLWLHRDTSAYCPNEPDQCPPGNLTAFGMADSLEGTLSMDVAVPGGQRVFVNQGGEIKYTLPHSAAVDTNSSISGWQLTPSVMSGFGKLSWAPETGGASGGFVACPGESGSGEWTVLAMMGDDGTSFVTAGCSLMEVLVPMTADGGYGIDGPAAWEYE
ncbi:hypothetical protein EJ06DRAFT_533733 [Trichodelitschia bisporula]|uniref:Cell wall protein PhiA n=1 Tax=Trichodelitschia bisporula TaxID=703511 RepID=A0A6G1HLX7_9PEZI|nr:hypothetical protein EJ06DRAFT_533733 [Trichodelitschia bisporula]